MTGPRKEPPKLDFLKQSEHFIPIRQEVLLQAVLEDVRLNETEREDFRLFVEMLNEHYHFDYHHSFLQMKQAFAPFDPDRETVYEPEYTEAYKAECRETLIQITDQFLTAGNYQILTEEELNECLKLQPFGGLRLEADTRNFASFQLYYRGIRDAQIHEKKWFFWNTTRDVKELKRVFLLARYKDELGGKILIKQFRNIPIECLRVVMPEVQLQLPLFAWLKVGGTFAGSMAAPLFKVFVAAVAGTVGFFVALFALIMACVKSFFGILNSRTKCLQIYSSNLYHKSLSNNVAAVSLLVDQAETQEVKEAFLAFFALYVERNQPMTQPALDAWVEAWLQQKFGFSIDFEVHDALRKLQDKHLLESTCQDSDGETVYSVPCLPDALCRLDVIWDNIHTHYSLG